MTREYNVSQDRETLLPRLFCAEFPSFAAAKLAVLIPIADWNHVGGTRYRLTLYVTDCKTREKTEHTFVADVKEVAQ